MDFVVIFGPPAVGKMAVGMALEKKTGLKLFHNHMSIEFVQPFFNYGTKTGKRLVGEFRRRIFEEVAESDLRGMIFTYVWAFNLPSEKEYVDRTSQIFEAKGGRVLFVELYAPVEIRTDRNKTPLRLANKSSKRDLTWSHNNMIEMDSEHRMNTNSDFYYPERHLKIDNSDRSPEDVADQIFKHFAL